MDSGSATTFKATWTYVDYLTKMRATESDDVGIFKETASSVEKHIEMYVKKLTPAEVKAAIEEAILLREEKSAMEGLDGYAKFEAITVSEADSDDEARKQNVDALIRADQSACYPPCSREDVMEGIRPGEIRMVLRNQGRFIQGDDLEVLSACYLEFTKGPLISPAMVDAVLGSEEVEPRPSDAPWPYASFEGPQGSGADGLGAGGGPKPLTETERLLQALAKRRKSGKTPKVGFNLPDPQKTARGRALLARSDGLAEWMGMEGRSEGRDALLRGAKRFEAGQLGPEEFEELLDEGQAVKESVVMEDGQEEPGASDLDELEMVREAILGGSAPQGATGLGQLGSTDSLLVSSPMGLDPSRVGAAAAGIKVCNAR